MRGLIFVNFVSRNLAKITASMLCLFIVINESIDAPYIWLLKSIIACKLDLSKAGGN